MNNREMQVEVGMSKPLRISILAIYPTWFQNHIVLMFNIGKFDISLKSNDPLLIRI